MQRFTSLAEAQDYVCNVVDRPVLDSVEVINPGMLLTKSAIDIGGGKFTNSYDLAFNGSQFRSEIVAFDKLTSVYDFMSRKVNQKYVAATGGGFFYLADRASGSPRQLALNMSISRDELRSLPVRDSEAVIIGPHAIEVRTITALGSLSLNGHDLDWSGSLTDYDTDVKVFSNGNIAITHEDDPVTGTARVLDETSRYTPRIDHDDYMDVGFIGRGRNDFIGVDGSTSGGVDIFTHDFVVRCAQRYLDGNSELKINTVGGIALSRFKGGAFSAGPALNITDFTTHPINHDASLGNHPPFLKYNLARSVIYKDESGLTHIRLFDGRPESISFPGVTPNKAASIVMSEGEIEWGCFLDPGQTAKLCVNYEAKTESYGNRHYLNWPNEANPQFVWMPEAGRPVANAIALQL